jgi:hypothetical protein
MHAVSLTPHAKYDIACTIEERFERPWHCLKGMSIRNIQYMFLNCPTSPLKNFFFCVRKSIISRRIRSRTRESGAQGVIFYEKNRGSKISWHCPFKWSAQRWIVKFWTHSHSDLHINSQMILHCCQLYAYNPLRPKFIQHILDDGLPVGALCSVARSQYWFTATSSKNDGHLATSTATKFYITATFTATLQGKIPYQPQFLWFMDKKSLFGSK